MSDSLPEAQILDLSNRFYTLIPHDFGMKKPPLLSNLDYIQVWWTVYSVFITESFQTNAAPSPLLRPRFRCWTTCWTLRWRTACWGEGPRTTRTTPSTSTMKNSKPLLRWAADDWVVVVRGDACVFDLPVCCPAGHRHVCQGGWHYSAVCQEHPRCHTQHLHTGSARSKHSGSIGPFFFFFCWLSPHFLFFFFFNL